MPTQTVTRQQPGLKHGEVEHVKMEIAWSFYDLTNPLKARRVIFDGIENKTPIAIEPGETRKGVKLADEIAERLMGRNDDLKVKKSAEQPKEVLGELGAPKASSR